MADDRRKHGKTAAVVGGGVLLAWLLLGGKGWGRGDKRGATGTEPRRVRIRISDAGITADGALVTSDEAVAAARRTGAAEVFATGAARQGTVDDLIAGLRAAGVDVWRVGGSHA